MGVKQIPNEPKVSDLNSKRPSEGVGGPKK